MEQWDAADKPQTKKKSEKGKDETRCALSLLSKK